MSCQELQANVTTAARPSGMLTTAARMVGNGLCRTFDFTVPTGGNQIQTFAGDDVQTFGGDNLVTFG